MRFVSTRALGSALLLAGTLLAGTAQASEEARTYEVTITNATRGQVITPAVLIAHDRGFSLFEIGSAASAGLAHQAEEGDPSVLIGELAEESSVDAVEVVFNFENVDPVPPVLLPSQSASAEITTSSKYLTVSAMLAVTNDGFAAVRGVKLPKKGSITVYANVYDAGSEANSEEGIYIPGLGGGGSHDDTREAEGFVHVHSGVHGGADLNPADHDWNNPAIQIDIRVVGSHD